MSRRHCQRSRPLAALGWAFCFFIGLQVALNLVLDHWFPEVYDPEFYVRLQTLRKRMEEEPGHPLVLLLGSSRTDKSFLPETLPPLETASGVQALPFNFSHLGAGPAMNLVAARRLLGQGIRPDWLVVEVMPPQLADPKQNLIMDTAAARDFPTVARCRGFLAAGVNYVLNRLVPFSKHRSFLVRRLAPQWLPPDPLQWDLVLGPLGGDFAFQYLPPQDPIETRRHIAQARDGYFPNLQKFRIGDMSDRAFRDLLSLCRRERIHVVLLLTPEGSDFQSWYSPEGRARIDQYCAALSQAYQVPVIDARNWLPDSDFADSHHVLLSGAQAFTRRLGQEVLQPLVKGSLPTEIPALRYR